MGASSVTGTGKGSVEKYGGGKGPGNLRTNFVPMMTPHVVAAGTATTVSNGRAAADVVFATELPLSSAYYAVIVTPTTLVELGVSKTDDDDQMSGFTVTTGAGDATFDWVVIRIGQGLETQVNWVPEEGNSVAVE